jgi:hypothetical protein
MNTENTMLLYNDKDHWNFNLRDEFFSRVSFSSYSDFGHVGQELLWLQQGREAGDG